MDLTLAVRPEITNRNPGLWACSLGPLATLVRYTMPGHPVAAEHSAIAHVSSRTRDLESTVGIDDGD